MKYLLFMVCIFCITVSEVAIFGADATSIVVKQPLLEKWIHDMPAGSQHIEFSSVKLCDTPLVSKKETFSSMNAKVYPDGQCLFVNNMNFFDGKGKYFQLYLKLISKGDIATLTMDDQVYKSHIEPIPVTADVPTIGCLSSMNIRTATRVFYPVKMSTDKKLVIGDVVDMNVERLLIRYIDDKHSEIYNESKQELILSVEKIINGYSHDDYGVVRVNNGYLLLRSEQYFKNLKNEYSIVRQHVLDNSRDIDRCKVNVMDIINTLPSDLAQAVLTEELYSDVIARSQITENGSVIIPISCIYTKGDESLTCKGLVLNDVNGNNHWLTWEVKYEYESNRALTEVFRYTPKGILERKYYDNNWDNEMVFSVDGDKVIYLQDGIPMMIDPMAKK